ncbi:hypothetical protein G4O51_07810 [Candidatus Bathyarchaeota archaeon A05DMB-2]|nr:hypothetical protein [Candidatus Bathyarchaeota archaeon A05DMB-2]
MTKQSPEEIAVKCHLSLEEASKVCVTDVLDKDVLGMRGAQVRPTKIGKPKVKVAVAKRSFVKGELAKIMSELYDIESCEHEKRLKIELDVDLYQMEKV